jgi:dolichol-phosphate mannosyltransferase
MRQENKSNAPTAVIIPAYYEIENLSILIPEIKHILPQSYIFIVDDSPMAEFNTLKKILKSKNFFRVNLINRGQKKGRGSAVREGIIAALKNSEIKYFIEMDADLAHSPKEFIRLLSQGKKGDDMVIGSRYLTGSIIKDWPYYRLFQSKLINKSLYYFLGLHLSDFTNGFRLYNRHAAALISENPLREKGFIALSEIAYRVKKAGLKISEVPISFSDRRYGKSNADLKELVNSLIGIIRIRLFC